MTHVNVKQWLFSSKMFSLVNALSEREIKISIIHICCLNIKYEAGTSKQLD